MNFYKKKSPQLPTSDQKNILITSALPYCNNIPHLGNIIGCVLSADVFARYCKLKGFNTLYVCGTDEYGTATETKAIEANQTPQQICDLYHKEHADCYKWFRIDFDIFGRTSTPEQTKITQEIFLQLHHNDKTRTKVIPQLYCTVHNSFLADRFVVGICPSCGYDDARGDQCDACGKLVNAIELIEPRCKLDNGVPEIRQSEHVFLELDGMQSELEAWIRESSIKGKWSNNSITITNTWLKEGLKPRCITRDLKWGVSVPLENFGDKVFYVWFDAPIGYLSITSLFTPDWEAWWKNPDNVALYQFMGKDNVPFHTVMFPSSLIGTGSKYTLLHHLSTTEYLQYENSKFSKSRGVGVFGNNVAESGIPCDVWRYYLLSNRPETADSQFTWQNFVLANNSELLANLGNYVNRIMKFVNSKYSGKVPAYSYDSVPEKSLLKNVNELIGVYCANMDDAKSLRAGLKTVMEISSVGNAYLQDSKLDNSLFTNAKEKCDTVIGVSLNLVFLLSGLVYPFLPDTADSIIRQLGVEGVCVFDNWKGVEIKPTHVVNKPEYLFSKIEESRIEELRFKYSGQNQAAQPEASKKKKKLVNEAPEGMTKTEKVLELENNIKTIGDEIRNRKANGEDCSNFLKTLVAHKEELTDLVEEYTKDKKEKKEVKKEVKKKAEKEKYRWVGWGWMKQ